MTRSDFNQIWRAFWLLVFGPLFAFVLLQFAFLALVVGRDNLLRWYWLPFTVFFLISDVVVNTIPAAIMFRELPRWRRGEFLLTDRLIRLKVIGEHTICFICSILSILDPRHC